MKITLLEVQKEGDNKDYNAGFGTTFDIGNSFLAKLLRKVRYKAEYMPLMSYGYLAAIFGKNGHTVEFVRNDVPHGSDLVVIHSSLIRYNLEISFIRRIRTETDSKIGVVGPLASVRPDLFLGYADFVVQGEPEEFALKLKNEIPKGLVKSNPVKDLNSLPFPDWSIFPIREFSNVILPKRPFMFIQSSRGCTYMCDYCPYKVFGFYRERNAENVVDEIEQLVKMYGIRSLKFRDPCFTLNKKRAADIARGIIARGINVEWGCETRLDNLDEELLDLLYKSGLRAIKVGVESLDEHVLSEQKRLQISLEHQEKIIRYCDEKGIKVVAFYIIGLEEDTKETVMKTIRYAKKLNTDFANFTICTPIPGTEYYERIKHRIYEENWEKFNNFNPVFRHKNLSEKELRGFLEKAVVYYYLRPQLVLKHLKRDAKIHHRNIICAAYPKSISSFHTTLSNSHNISVIGFNLVIDSVFGLL